MTTSSLTSLLGRGARSAGRAWTTMLSYYVITLLLVTPLAMMFHRLLVDHLGMSPLVERMLERFNYTVYFDFTHTHEEAVAVFTSAFFPVALASAIIHALLGPGLVGTLIGDGTAREFFRQAGRFLGRATRLTLIVGLVASVVLVVWSIAIGLLWMALTGGNAVESDYLVAMIVCGVLYAIPVALFILGAEYARVLTVTGDRTGMWRAVWDGFGFALRRPGAMLILHGSVALLLVLWVAAYLWLESTGGMTSVAGILVFAVVQQLSVVGRIYVRQWNTANAVELVRSATAVTEPAPSPAITLPPTQTAAPVSSSEVPVVAPGKRRSAKRTVVRRRPAAPRRAPRKGRRS